MPHTDNKFLLDTAAQSGVSIPAPHPNPFRNGIAHPDLWLWDSWTYEEAGGLHLYALSLNRTAQSGAPIMPEDRNNHPFHIRHFKSQDFGNTWTDLGAILTNSDDPRSFYSRNVWSGSVTRLPDGRKLMGFTGLREVDAVHPFLQSVAFAVSSDGSSISDIAREPASCPQRDYDAIVKAGYYLGPKDALGHKDGEEGGPILAWRDPYVFVDRTGTIHALWSAKISPIVGCVAHATLKETDSGFEVDELLPPITLPDGDTITQAEVPKIYHDAKRGNYYLLISACDRLYEGQDDSEVTKTLRLYKAPNIHGPWVSYHERSTPILPGLPNIFGASAIKTDFEAREFHLVAPVTERAPTKDQLTFAPVQTIKI